MLVLFAAIAAACLLATPAAAEDRPWPRRVSELRFLLKTERFAELDETIGLAQRRFERGETTEDEPWAMLQAFFENDSGTERWLKAWSDKRPVSYLALAARGLYYEGTGWSVRGKEWVQETASGQIRRMSEMHAVAESDCEKALSGAPSLVACHVALINIAKATGDQTLVLRPRNPSKHTPVIADNATR